MRRSGAIMVLALCLLALSCRLPVVAPLPATAPRVTQRGDTVTPTATLSPSATEPLPRHSTFTPTPVPTRPPVHTVTPPTAVPVDPHLSPDDVLIFPWPLHEGDRISADVDPELAGFVDRDHLDRTAITLAFDGTGPLTATVSSQGLDGAPQARFYWAAELTESLWDGAGSTGYPVTVSLTLTLVLPDSVADPDLSNNTVVIPVQILPREALLPPELTTQWAVTETVGVRLHYLEGSAADRDLASLLYEANVAYEAISTRLGEPDDLVDIYLLDRVIGQGGYASSEWVAVTYTDRRYSPVALGSVLRHELTHRLDDAIGCDSAPSIIREGLAVYMAGGHYRPEPLRQKASALLTAPDYIHVSFLVTDFYAHQHEVAYLEAGAIVAYLIDTYGWQSLVDACQAAEVGGDDAARWEAVLASLDFEGSDELERRWSTWLVATRGEAGAEGTRYDPALLELELRLMDAMRAYQASYDPAAHFLQGILFSPAEGERLEIVADFVRRPRNPVSIGFELVLMMGQEAVERRDMQMLALLVEDLELALTQGPHCAVFVRDAIEIAELTLDQGWEPSYLLLTLGTYPAASVPDETERRYLVTVLDRQSWPQQSVLVARRVKDNWEIQGISSAP